MGFLGLGIMGRAMAINLIRNGFKVTVWNRTLSKVFSVSPSVLDCEVSVLISKGDFFF